MDLAELQKRVNQFVQLDLGPLYEAYLEQGGEESVDGFLTFLGTARIVDASLLKELHGMTDVEIPAVTDAAFAGTSLAQWAKTHLGSSPGGSSPEAQTVAEARTAHDGTPLGATASQREEPAAVGQDQRFTPITKLGEGAMGAVHIAQDLYLRRKVALKSVLPEMAQHQQLIGRFLSEMQITAQLEHPNIVPVYALEVGADGSLGYAMKLVQGKDLEHVIEETRALAGKGKPLGEEHKLEKRLEYFLKVCDALEYAHARGIVHRDLKPANIMIGRHNEVYLMDWGIARPMGAGGQALEAGIELHHADGSQGVDLNRTRVGSAIGTPYYMSPEQAAGKNSELDGRSDEYTMGLILHELVSLKRAVDGDTLEEVLTKAKEARRDPVAIGDTDFHLPREIEAICKKATRLNPKDRYPSVRALADDVRRYMRGEAVEALPEGGIRTAGRWLSKHRTASLLLILSLGLVGAGGTIGALVTGQARIDAEHARELRVSQMQTEAAIQAQLVDRALTRYESALTEFAGAAQIVLSKMPPGEFAPFYDDLLASKATAPPDFGPSKRYGRDVTILAPAVTLGPGVQREAIDALARTLGLLAPAFRELMIGSSGMDWHTLTLQQQRAVIVDTGVPAFRASIGLREGFTLSFPGMGGLTPSDPREATYFKMALVKPGVTWGAPEGEKDQTLPASVALYDDRGAFRGVAQLEVSVARLLDNPNGADLDYVQSRLLLGRDGKVMAEDNKGGTRAPIAPEVAAAIAAGKSGSLVATVEGHTWQYAYYPLASLDWYYVSAGQVERMMTSTAKVVTSDLRKVIAALPKPPPPPAKAAPLPTIAPLVQPPIVDAGAADAGADAGAESADGGVPWWKKNKKGTPAPAAAGTAAPTAKPVEDLPPNPFDRWKVYDKPGGN